MRLSRIALRSIRATFCTASVTSIASGANHAIRRHHRHLDRHRPRQRKGADCARLSRVRQRAQGGRCGSAEAGARRQLRAACVRRHRRGRGQCRGRRGAHGAQGRDPGGPCQQRRHRGVRTVAGAAGRRFPPAARGQRDGAGDRHQGVRAALGRRSVAAGAARADRDDQFGGGQERQSAAVALRYLQACRRRPGRKPAPRIHAVRHRRHRYRAGRGEDADLGQGRGDRHRGLSRFAVLCCAGAAARLHAENSPTPACRRSRSANWFTGC